MNLALFALGHLADPNSQCVGGKVTDKATLDIHEFKRLLQGTSSKISYLDEIQKTFCAIVDKKWTEMGNNPEVPVEELLKLKIDIHNLQQACHRFDVKLSEAELKNIVHDTDRDGSEDVDWKEYEHILKYSCWY